MFTNLTKLAKSIKNGTMEVVNNALDAFKKNEFAVNTLGTFNGNMKFFSRNNPNEPYAPNKPFAPREPLPPTQPESFHLYDRNIRDVSTVAAENVYEKMRQYDRENFYHNSPEWSDLSAEEQNKYVSLVDDMDHGRASLQYNPHLSEKGNERNSFLFDETRKAIDNYYYQERTSERNYNAIRQTFSRHSSNEVLDIASRATYENLRQYDKKTYNVETAPWEQLHPEQQEQIKRLVKDYDDGEEPLSIGVDGSYSGNNPRERLTAFRSIAKQSLEVAQTGNYEQTVKNVSHFYDEKMKREGSLKTATRATYEVMRDLDKRLYKQESKPWEQLSPGVQEEMMRRVDAANHGVEPMNPNHLGTGPQVLEAALGRDVRPLEEAREKYKMEYFKLVANRAIEGANKDNYDNILNNLKSFHEDNVAPKMGYYFYDDVVAKEKEYEATAARNKYQMEQSEAAQPTQSQMDKEAKALMSLTDMGM